MCKRILALVVFSAGMSGGPSLAADAFSDIPLSELKASPLPDPQWSPPKVASTLYPFERPGGFFKKPVTGCRLAVAAIHVNDKGEFVEARLDGSSGSETFDEAVLDYVKKGQRYAPAKFDGRPMDGWTLQRFKFVDDDCSLPDSSTEAPSISSYNSPIKALVEEAKAKNAALLAEQQKNIDEQERRRYLTEEPYRKPLPPGSSMERQAVNAAERYYNLVHCGDSRFDVEHVEGGSFIHEFKGVRFEYKSADQLTKIDRANGYEWRGRVTFDCEMTRFHGSEEVAQSGWRDWESCRWQTIRVWKRHGKWHAGDMRSRPRRPLSCAAIPRD